MSAQATIAVALLGSGGLTAVITWWLGRRQTEASVASVLVETAMSQLPPLQSEITRLQLVVAGQNTRISEQDNLLVGLRAEVMRLHAETEACHRDRDADRVRITAMEQELARYKGGPDAAYDKG